MDKDTTYKDNIENIFYILIYFLNGILPWKIPKKFKKRYDKREILEIRKKISPDKLFSKFPEPFILLYKRVLKANNFEISNYLKIYKYLILL